MSDEKRCERYGCGKKLRKDNTKGVCSTGCLSSLAPATARAKTTNAHPAAPAPAPRGERSALERFRLVCDALGKDAEAELEHLASQWLRALAEKVAP